MSIRNWFHQRISGPRSAEQKATGRLRPSDIRELWQDIGLSERDARRVYHVVFGERGLVDRAVDAGWDVELTGLGTFTRREMSAGQIHHPATGEILDVPARDYPAFRVSQKWRDRVRRAGHKEFRR